MDDHSGGEHSGVRQDLKADWRISALIRCDEMTDATAEATVTTMLAQ
jgi:hypothetical protein